MARAGVALYDTAGVIPVNPASWAGPKHVSVEVELLSHAYLSPYGSPRIGDNKIDFRPVLRAAFPVRRVAIGLEFDTPGEKLASVGAVFAAPIHDRGAAGVEIRYYHSSADYFYPLLALKRGAPAAFPLLGISPRVRDGWGVTIGHYLRVTENVRLGVAYDTGVQKSGGAHGELDPGLEIAYPTRATWGASYTPEGKATFLWDFAWTDWRRISDEHRNTVDVRLGADYRLVEAVSIRVGFISRGNRGTAPDSLSFYPASESTGQRFLTAGASFRHRSGELHFAVEDNHLLDRNGGPKPEAARETFVSLSVGMHPRGR